MKIKLMNSTAEVGKKEKDKSLIHPTQFKVPLREHEHNHLLYSQFDHFKKIEFQ